MEDIYDDLNNYEDVHALEELRAENKELKVKLEEHSAALEKLQKEILQDYDNLEMAFKQLENNYSSLLMTARSEIQRKTQRITQLNTEKDLMVLDALKNGKYVRRNWTGVNNPGRMNQDRPVKGPNKNKEVNLKQKNIDIKTERHDQTVLSTKEAGPESSSYNSNKSGKSASVKLELNDSRKINVNDNIAQHKTEVNEPPRTSASSIKDRRKSTPALRMPIDTFSSGDELERNYPTKDTRTENERRNINKVPIERNSYKPSETSSVDDRGHKPHESSSRENKRRGDRSRSSIENDNSSYRDGDKYEVSLKYRKQHSPERGQKRPHQEYQDDYRRPHREHQNDYPRQARDYQGDFPRQPREYQDDYARPHREHQNDYARQAREHKGDFPRQPREHQYDYTRKPREHVDDYPKQPKENQDDYNRKPREHLDPRQPRENQDDYPKKRREHPDDKLRQPRDHSADHSRHERGRYPKRSLETPPPESYNRRQRTKSSHRSDHDKYPHDQEKNKHYHDDKYSTNYKSNDHDEPLLKKKRTESYGNSDAHSVDDRCYRERESMDAQPTPVFTPHEYDMLRYSCQSPDSVHSDADIAKPPTKEIMTTADTPQADPRITSKRYVVQIQNGKEFCLSSTAVDKNIDVRPVNKALWNIKPVDMPVALVRRPSHCSDQLVKDIYMDIDNSVTSLGVSRESGEVCRTDDEIPEIRSKLKEIQHNTQDIKISKQASEDISKQLVKAQTVSKPNIAKYRIPKTGLNNKDTHSKMDVPIIELAENVPHHKKDSKKSPAKHSIPKELLTHKQQNNKHEDVVLNNKNNSKVEDTKKLKSLDRGEDNQSTLTKMAIVADDLELSDDNSDHDTGKTAVPEKVQIICEIPLINMLHSEARSNDSINKIENKTVDSAHNTEIKRTDETAGIKDVADEEKTKDSDSTKKQKTKRKKTKSKEVPKDSVETPADPIHVPEKKIKTKSKEVSKDSVETPADPIHVPEKKLKTKLMEVPKDSVETTADPIHVPEKKLKTKSMEVPKDSVETADSRQAVQTADPIHVPEKKMKSKKEKESTPKEIKEKFCDLFGDSSSLMTPEDLGIPSYLPISEDAHDAVDMKINQIIDAAPLVDRDEVPGDLLPQNRVEVTIQETTANDDIPIADLQKSNTEVEGQEIRNKPSSKENEEIVDTNQLPSPIVYENLNPGTDLNDPNIVKTVIISTGKQPEIAYETKIEITEPAAAVAVNAIQNTNDTHLFATKREFNKDILKALATSTPHKEFSAVEAHAAKTDVCDPCISQAVATITNVEPVVNQTENSTLESNDAPDVRIFVKRRRKVIKRPMT